MEETHPAAGEHLPAFITGPGQTDVLFVVMAFFLIGAVLLIGTFYFRLHALPERMAHRGQKVQFEIVAVLALLALFTHNHLFWIAGLLLALVQLPDFSTPIGSMARSLEKLANGGDRHREEELRKGESAKQKPHNEEPGKEEPGGPRKEDLTLVPETEPPTKVEARG
jgi:hypothetical protein